MAPCSGQLNEEQTVGVVRLTRSLRPYQKVESCGAAGSLTDKHILSLYDTRDS